MQERVLGVTCPLFSLRPENEKDDWGKGQISDLVLLAALAKKSGALLLQILPPHELAEHESSPYGALSAFALDPTYITLSRVPEFVRDASLEKERARLAALSSVDYSGVLALKKRALESAFTRFENDEWKKKTARADALVKFANSESWVYDYALYSMLRASHNGFGVSTWPAAERHRTAEFTKKARGLDDRLVLECVYLQWIAFTEWRETRAELAKMGVALMGDLPFIVGTESADAWCNPTAFDTSVSLGAPPDDFSADGQDWGLPSYTASELESLMWLSHRSAHAAHLYDAFRIDHVVGFFRQWVKPHATHKGEFRPEHDAAQAKLGAHVLSGVQKAASGARVIAEDLGVIPAFVRETLKKLSVPGYKIVPWERDERLMIRSPQDYPKLSVAAFGTHDTAPITSWWDELKPWERDQIAGHAGMRADAPEAERHAKLSRMLLAAPSDIVLLQVQELVGDGERVNLPASVGPHNWTYRVKKPLPELMQDTRIAERLAVVREASIANGRVK